MILWMAMLCVCVCVMALLRWNVNVSPRDWRLLGFISNYFFSTGFRQTTYIHMPPKHKLALYNTIYPYTYSIRVLLTPYALAPKTTPNRTVQERERDKILINLCASLAVRVCDSILSYKHRARQQSVP